MAKNITACRRSGGERILTIVIGVAIVLGLMFAAASRQEVPHTYDAATQEEKLAAIESGKEYPKKLVEMAQNNAETIDFVYHYPERKNERPRISLHDEMQEEGVPLLMQWDERWGYQNYANGPVGYTGCGPTCLSMAALYLTRNDKWNPARVAEMAEKNGYAVEGKGSSWTLISEGSRKIGLKAEMLPLSKSAMLSHLDAGELIILVVGPGDFTRSGHFLVVTGYEQAGFRINDPNSRENSGKVWSYTSLKGQIRNLWAISAA